MTFDQINDWLIANNCSAILADGLEYALIGFKIDGEDTIAIYDYDAILLCMMTGGMSLDEAEEYFDYNIERGAAALGPNRPLFIVRPAKCLN